MKIFNAGKLQISSALGFTVCLIAKLFCLRSCYWCFQFLSLHRTTFYICFQSYIAELHFDSHFCRPHGKPSCMKRNDLSVENNCLHKRRLMNNLYITMDGQSFKKSLFCSTIFTKYHILAMRKENTNLNRAVKPV